MRAKLPSKALWLMMQVKLSAPNKFPTSRKLLHEQQQNLNKTLENIDDHYITIKSAAGIINHVQICLHQNGLTAETWRHKQLRDLLIVANGNERDALKLWYHGKIREYSVPYPVTKRIAESAENDNNFATVYGIMKELLNVRKIFNSPIRHSLGKTHDD